MANLNDLPISSLSSLDDEAGLELILSMRERRRFSEPKPVREPKARQIPTESVIAKMNEKQLAELYYSLASKMQKELRFER